MSTPPEADEQDHPEEPLDIHARQVLRVKKLWIVPLMIATIFVALMSVIYIGSVVNPTGHLHDLPVVVVNEDAGATVNGRKMTLGAEVVKALLGTPAVTERLKLTTTTLASAEAIMNRAGAYATLVIPRTFSRSILTETGAATPSASVPAAAATTLEENSRLGSIGVNLAAGVLAPAISKISVAIANKLTPLETAAAKTNPVNAAALGSPITMTTAGYRPLPDHTALGLSAFYAALLAIMSGFIGATLINNSVDAALGYGSTEIGPRRRQVRPLRINRRRTLLVKWSLALAAAPLLTGMLLLVSAVVLQMHAPNFLLLWLLLAFASLMIATGTLSLLAAFGSIGQLLAMILLVYLSLASSGGTIPIQALPGFFKLVGHVEPLRQVLGGSRAILYFNAKGDAGLTHSLILIASELLFWAALGLAASWWYDRKKLYRIAPDILTYVENSIEQRLHPARVAEVPTEADG
jgi:YhgE/Pip-like protein